MTTATAILGKGGVGKTLVAAHLAMAFSYLGVRTLLVGCDQKRDTHRALGVPGRPCLMEAFERAGGNAEEVDPSLLLAPASKYVDVLELGPSQLLVGDYAAVYETSFRVFQNHALLAGYDQVLFDVTDERFDAPNLPLFRTLNFVVGVTDDQPESLFVLNRMLRGMLIGWNEFKMPVRVLGAVYNRAAGAGVFQRYVERTRAVPLRAVVHVLVWPLDPQHRLRRRRVRPAAGVVRGPVPARSVVSPVEAVDEEDRLVVVRDDLHAGCCVHEVGAIARYAGRVTDLARTAREQRRKHHRRESESVHGDLRHNRVHSRCHSPVR